MKDNHTPGPVEDRLEEAMRLDEYIGTYKEMIGFQQLVLEGIVELRKLRQYSDGCPCDKFEYMADLLGQCLEALEELVTEITNWEDDVRSVIQIPIEHGMDLSKAKAILTKRKGGSYEEKSMFQMR